MIRRGLLGSAAVAVAAVLAAGCSGGAGAGAASVTELTMASAPGDVTRWAAVADFVARFRELSSGVSVTVVDRWGDLKPGNEQQIVRDVAAGKADVGWVGAHVFDTLGVPALSALNAPMLIDGYALEQAVVDSAMSREMLAGVDRTGVHGLALFAGEMHKPVSVRRPLLGPSDWRGAKVGTARSAVHTAAIEALGATPQDAVGDARDAALDSGELGAFDMSLHGYQFGTQEKRAPYVTANVDLWPEMMVVIVNPAKFAKLRQRERGWLEQAAREVAARSAKLSGGEERLVTQECQLGTRIGMASPGDLAALRRAFEPVYTKLGQDSVTKQFIGRIEDLKRATPADPQLSVPTGCGPGDPPATAPSPSTAANPLLGTWEAASPHPYLFEVTAAAWTQLERQSDGSTAQGWRGTYAFQGSTVRLTEIGTGCELEYGVALQADGLRIKVLEDGPADNPDCGASDLAVQRFIYETAPFHKIK